MFKLLLGAASVLLALGLFVGMGFAAHDGGAIPYQGAISEAGV